MPFAKKIREYYKYGTEPNVIGVGSPTIDNGVARGFSASNHLSLPTLFDISKGEAWEVVFKFNTNSPSTQQTILGSAGSRGYNPRIRLLYGVISIMLSNSTSSANVVSMLGVTSIVANTDYWIKAEFTGSAYNLYLSTDGVIYNLEATKETTTVFTASYQLSRIGYLYDSGSSAGYPFDGSIDLTQSYIKINGQNWWHGSRALGGGTYTATSGWANISNVFDYNSSTYATCGTATDYIEYDFGKNVYINGIYATGYFASSVSRAMGLRVYAVENNIERFLGETNKAEASETYSLSSSFSKAYCSKIRIKLATSNKAGDPPTTSYKTRIRQILIKGFLEGDSSDFDIYDERNKLYQMMANKKTYYKYGKDANVVQVGSWGTILNGVASGFNASNYLKLPEIFNPNGSWEVVVGFNFTGVNKTGSIFGTTTQYGGAALYVGSDNKLSFYVSSNGTSWDVASAVKGTTVFTTDVNYIVKIAFDGSKYAVAVSIDGSEFVTDITVSSTKVVYGSPCALGGGVSTNTSGDQLTGSINLNKSYININGERWWTGNEYIKVGSWIDNGVAENFSKSVYLQVPSTVPFADANSWEKVIKFTYKSTSAYKVFMATNNSSALEDSMGYSTVVGMYCGVNKNDHFVKISGTTNLQDGKTYWVKGCFTGSEYKLYLSDTGKFNGEESLEGSVSSTTKCLSRVHNIGTTTISGYEYVSDSTIDLSESYIKINDKIWWYGTKAEKSNYSDYSYYTERLLAYNPVLKSGKKYVPIFTKSTAGTYEFEMSEDSNVRITLVGGGGAAAMRGVYDDRGYGWGGGSGGAFIGTFNLPAGIYSVTVGSANNNTTKQSGNTQTLNPSDTSTHDSYITGVVRVGGGGSGHYNSSYVGAGGASATFDIEPTSITMNKSGNSGKSGSGGKGSQGPATCAGGDSVYGGYGKGQGCKTSEYASNRSWINGTDGFVRIEIWSESANQLF